MLRIWVDLKQIVDQLARERGIQFSFNQHSPPKFIKKGLRGAVHTYLPLASGVPNSDVQVSGLRITNRALSPEEIMQRARAGPPIASPKAMNFGDWLGAGVVEVPSGFSGHPHVSLSREILIKRVANALGASHPIGCESDDLMENRFGPYVKDLHAISLDGVPSTFYALMEIADEVVDTLRPLRDIT